MDVQELRIRQSDLNTKRMLDLMAVSSIQGGMPLYLHAVTRLLREQRIKQQEAGTSFNYLAFKQSLEDEDFSAGQRAPLEQRLDTPESFMAKEHVVPVSKGWSKKQRQRFMIAGDTATS